MAATRVLIVDDRPQVRQDLRTLLPLLWQVEVVGEAGDGAEAVQVAAALHPDVVLLDLEMPGVDGYEAARQIKSRGLAKRIVVLTVHGYPEAREKAWQAGVDDFVEKGSAPAVLGAAILGHNRE